MDFISVAFGSSTAKVIGEEKKRPVVTKWNALC